MLVAAFACKNDDEPKKEDNTPQTSSVDTLKGEISSNMTLDASKKYIIKDLVYVTKGATLSIPAGTVLLGDKFTKGTLIITRGSKIDAKGTADKPIIFSSNAPVGYRNRGDWGGIVILGKASNNKGADVSIEGLNTSDTRNLFGGSDDADNSGTLQYARIEFAGIALSANNELNSLTLGAVGSGTTIDHIMVSYAGDDAIEWFGGKVNVSHVVAYKSLDDDLDSDNGYSGKVDHAVIVRDPNVADVSGSNGFESDNDANGSTNGPVTSATFDYITVLGPFAFSDKTYSSLFQNGAQIRRSSNINIKNSIIVGWPFGVFFDKNGSDANVNNVVIAKNSGKDVVKLQSFVKGTVPATAVIDSVADMTTVFASTGFRKLESPVVNDVTSQYSDAGAFAGSANWNWGSSWINFDPINAQY